METITEDLLRWAPDRVEALQTERLQRMIELCYEGHPFYREVMRSRGLTPADIQTLEDLERLPVTTKAQFVAEPEKFRLEPSVLPAEERVLAQVFYTTGSTTGIPAPIFETAADRYDYMLRSRRRMDFIPMRRGDLVASLFPLTPFPMGVYARCVAEVSACGGAVLFTDPGHQEGIASPHRRVDDILLLLQEHRPTVLWGISSFVSTVLQRLAKDGVTLPSLRMVMVTGERSTSRMIEQLHEGMRAVGAGDDIVVNRYGSTEQGSSMVECTPGSGFHDLAPDSVFMEVVDEATGRRLPDGEAGALAFTHLDKSGTVLLRFAMGDHAALSHEPCEFCGRTSARVVTGPSRVGDIVKVKGTLVNLAAIADRVETSGGVEEFQVVVDRIDGADRLLVRVATTDGTPPAGEAFQAIEAAVRDVAHLTPKVEAVSKDDLRSAVEGGKFRRVVDLRD
jgi:phenylacetate-CoA ligase